MCMYQVSLRNYPILHLEFEVEYETQRLVGDFT